MLAGICGQASKEPRLANESEEFVTPGFGPVIAD